MTQESKRDKAIGAIVCALNGRVHSIKLGQDLTPLAERIYVDAGRDVMEAFQEMDEAQQSGT